MNLELCVVIPTLNERDNIGVLLRNLNRVLVGVQYEVIVVDDDSVDGTADFVNQLSHTEHGAVRALHRIGRRGLASACIEGMLSTPAPYIAVMDADLQHDETILPAMLARLKDDQLDLVVASRNIEGGSMGEFAQSRVFLSRLGRRLSGVDKRADISDPMSGFFMLRRSYLNQVSHRLTGIGFKILLDLILSSSRPLRCAEVPYRFRTRERGESKLDIIVGLEYLELLMDKLIGDFASVRFVLFCLVGAFGLIIHLLLEWVLLHVSHRSFLVSQTIATGAVMIINFILNNSFTYRDRRLKGAGFWVGMVTFCIACSLGIAANLSISEAMFTRGVWWPVAATAGLMFSAVWNYGVTSVTIWRRTRKTLATRAERRLAAGSRMRSTPNQNL